MRASIVDRTSLLLRGVDTQYTGKNPIVLKLAFLKNIAQTYKNNLYGNMLFDKPAGVPTTN